MHLSKGIFDELAIHFMVLGCAYSTNAKLMIGGKGTPYPIHYETNRDQRKLYNILYASIDGVVHPVTPDIVITLTDESRAMAVPKGRTASMLYHFGVPHHCDKPLEVVAKEEHERHGIGTLWYIYMLRHLGEGEGYLNDTIANELLKKLN